MQIRFTSLDAIQLYSQGDLSQRGIVIWIQGKNELAILDVGFPLLLNRISKIADPKSNRYYLDFRAHFFYAKKIHIYGAEHKIILLNEKSQ